jgi:UDP-N-acetylglucosamine 2-epimerase (non-hydrolysing)
VSVGTNIVVGSDPQMIRDAVQEILAGRGKVGAIPELWDGRASQRAASVLMGNAAHRSACEG